MKFKQIPIHNLQAAIAILSPYAPELSPTALVQAIRQYDPTPQAKTDRLVGKHQAAEILNVSWYTVIAMAKDGRLPAKRVGGQWRFYLSGLVENQQDGGAEDE